QQAAPCRARADQAVLPGPGLAGKQRRTRDKKTIREPETGGIPQYPANRSGAEEDDAKKWKRPGRGNAGEKSGHRRRGEVDRGGRRDRAARNGSSAWSAGGRAAGKNGENDDRLAGVPVADPAADGFTATIRRYDQQPAIGT